MVGLWEFFGGKCEFGEIFEQVLVCELCEELGIEVDVGFWLMDVLQCYLDKYLILEVCYVCSWKGILCGCEGQVIIWVVQDKLGCYLMLLVDLLVVVVLC